MKTFNTSRSKIVRRFGVNIFENPKYDQILENRPNPPGFHSFKKRRAKVSEYGKQLVEKQKLKFSFGMTEKQFRRFYKNAEQMKGPTGDNLLKLLERRLDNVIYRCGFAISRAQARQLVNHGHVLINQKKVDIPSYLIQADETITIRTKESSTQLILRCVEENNWREAPKWLDVNPSIPQAVVMRIPERDEINNVADEQQIVELYSK